MLVLTRKSNQSIMIGDEIEVSVLSVMGEKVRIGIQAPQKVPVFRKEIYLEIHRETGGVAPEQDGHAPTQADGHAPAQAEGHAAAASASVEKSLTELSDGA
jgi:carbon storage regulator